MPVIAFTLKQCGARNEQDHLKCSLSCCVGPLVAPKFRLRRAQEEPAEAVQVPEELVQAAPALVVPVRAAGAMSTQTVAAKMQAARTTPKTTRLPVRPVYRAKRTGSGNSATRNDVPASA